MLAIIVIIKRTGLCKIANILGQVAFTLEDISVTLTLVWMYMHDATAGLHNFLVPKGMILAFLIWNAKFSYSGLHLLCKLYLLSPFPDFELHSSNITCFSFFTPQNLPCHLDLASAIYLECLSLTSTRLLFTFFSKSSSGVTSSSGKAFLSPYPFIPPSSVPSVFFYKINTMVVGIYWASAICARPWARHLMWIFIFETYSNP